MQLYFILRQKTLIYFQEYGFIKTLTPTKKGLIMESDSIEKVEAATYRKIIQFLREAKDVQNFKNVNILDRYRIYDFNLSQRFFFCPVQSTQRIIL